MASVTVMNIALGSRAAVRGAKVQQKRTVATKKVAAAARAELSNVEKAAAVAAVTVAAASPAQASELGEDLFAVFDSIDKAADKLEEAFGVVAQGVEKVGEVVDKVTPVVKPLAERAVSAATPVVKAGADYAGRAAGPIVSDAASKVSGAASGAANSAGAAIKAQGIDVEPAVSVVGKAAGAVGAAASSVLPSVDDVTGFLTTASPTELAEVAGGAAAIYLLSPVLLGVLGGVLRGYAGSTRPVEAYDLVTSGKCVIVDIRADTGRGEIKVPRGKVLSIPREKLSGSFAGDVEANLTALKVASLKGVKKGTKVLILDANGGGDATKVAKALASQGFGKTFVVQGGFNGWANAGLAIDR